MENDLERQLAEGSYKNSPEFIQNDDNLSKVIQYLERVKPRPEVMEILLSLLRFFRFPLALCCAALYRKLAVVPAAELEGYLEKVLDVAAYVRSLVAEMGTGMFTEIQFFMQFGHAKKKFKVNISEREREFARRILEMHAIKEELAAAKQWAEDTEEKINTFLSITFQGANVFEEKSIEIMKSSGRDLIDALFARREQQDRPQQVKRSEVRSVEKREEFEKPKRSESIPVHHQSSLPSSIHFSSASEVGGQSRGICCRTSFQRSEVVDQPQSLRIEYKFYTFPFRSKAGEFPSKRDKIKRTLCGFLNAEGGTIYFGIKELSDSKQRLINGMVLSQRSKKEFGLEIMALMKEVLPDVGKKWAVKYVPVKDKGNYITGCYVVKVTVERGSKDQVYSYLHETYNGSWIERFAFRTENEVLEITEIQRILKIFKNKVQSQERSYYPTHPHPCPEPELGKPLYEERYEYDEDSFEYEQRGAKYREKGQWSYNKYEKEVVQKRDAAYDVSKNSKDFPSVLDELAEDGQSSNWHEEEEYARNMKYAQKEPKYKEKEVKSKYMQKDTDELLLKLTKTDLQIMLGKNGITYKVITEMPDQLNWTYLQLERSIDKSKLVTFPGEVMEVYPRISYKKLAADQQKIMEDIIQNYRNKWSTITRERANEIVVFNSSFNACIFYLKMRDMGLNVEFTPMI